MPAGKGCLREHHQRGNTWPPTRRTRPQERPPTTMRHVASMRAIGVSRSIKIPRLRQPPSLAGRSVGQGIAYGHDGPLEDVRGRRRPQHGVASHRATTAPRDGRRDVRRETAPVDRQRARPAMLPELACALRETGRNRMVLGLCDVMRRPSPSAHPRRGPNLDGGGGRRPARCNGVWTKWGHCSPDSGRSTLWRWLPEARSASFPR